VQLVAKPKQAPTITPQPLAPLTVERIRAQLRPRDAMIVSLLAYAGLRPSEDRAGRWADVHGRALHVTATKTGRGRDVDLLTPLAQDLAEWRLASGRAAGKELIVPRPTGGEWTRADWANWRRRIWRPAAIGAGVTGDLRPYRLRGSFVSLLLWEGRSLAYICCRAGRALDCDARQALQRGDPRAGGQAARARGRGGPRSARADHRPKEEDGMKTASKRRWVVLCDSTDPRGCLFGGTPRSQRLVLAATEDQAAQTTASQ
jgi:hypothetical protein